MRTPLSCWNGHDMSVPSGECSTEELGRGWQPIMHCSRCHINETILSFETRSVLGLAAQIVEEAIERINFVCLVVFATVFFWVKLPKVEDER